MRWSASILPAYMYIIHAPRKVVRPSKIAVERGKKKMRRKCGSTFVNMILIIYVCVYIYIK